MPECNEGEEILDISVDLPGRNHFIHHPLELIEFFDDGRVVFFIGDEIGKIPGDIHMHDGGKPLHIHMNFTLVKQGFRGVNRPREFGLGCGDGVNILRFKGSNETCKGRPYGVDGRLGHIESPMNVS